MRECLEPPREAPGPRFRQAPARAQGRRARLRPLSLTRGSQLTAAHHNLMEGVSPDHSAVL
eukprot:2843395-Pyramimonas_sp.AAC.1